ncbi:DEAD/DEAH box helicase [Paracoccus litorisediminis]|uniref:ATP-dependent helicase n=1 Tax=Paracoccus litorisediminis TaxID=2006130 RepID=A0A844HRX3_9RHOB|nr:DEAD/DEAH box helicase [Paracoccus litorisediminis]MTH61184.1 ATP-dependent helicase [Paracoccus litorisediminis]
MSIVQIAKNPVLAKIVNPSREVVSKVSNLLSYSAESAPGWSGKSSFYDVLTGTFPAGFVHVISEELGRAGYTVQLIEAPAIQPLGPESPIVDEFGNDDPRYDYQMQVLKQVEKHRAGIVRVATGGGKSKVAKLIMARYNRMTLFLTTRGILLYQMKRQLDDNATETAVIGDGQMSFTRHVNLGMVQTLVQALEPTDVNKELRALVTSIHLNKAKDENTPRAVLLKQAQEIYERKTRKRDAIIKFLSLVEVVIGEEAHEAGGNSYYEILRHCKNAQIRIALTATPFMRSSAEDNMRLMAAFGPVLIDVPEKLLIDRGILAKPYFKLRSSASPKAMHRTSPFERAYKLAYVDGEEMTADILSDALLAKERKMPVLTLVLRKAHGDRLKKVFAENGLDFVFLRGEDDQATREKYLNRLVKGEIDGIIGTTILDVGVDVPAISLVQLAGGGKAEVALRQRVGRGLRAKKAGPNVTFVVDYTCNSNITLREHAQQREQIIRTTPGFAEGLLTDDEELPWHLFEENAEKAVA